MPLFKLFEAPINQRPIQNDGFFTHVWMRFFQSLSALFSSYNETDGNSLFNKYYFGYNENGGTLVDDGGIDIPIYTDVKKDSAFAHVAPSAEVEILETGIYEIIAEAGFDMDEDTTVEISLVADNVMIPGSVANCGV